MVTAIEVLDTAVKVGLGALITAIATYFSGRDKARMDRQSSFHQELRTLLRQIATEIAKADACLENYLHRAIAVSSDDPNSHASRHGGLLAECVSLADHAYALAGLSGHAGLRESVRDLMGAASQIFSEFSALRASDSFDVDRYSELVDPFNDARDAALTALAAAYAKTAA